MLVFASCHTAMVLVVRMFHAFRFQIHMCSLAQNPEKFARKADTAGFLPTITRGSRRLWSTSHSRWMLSLERLLAHGIPITTWASSRSNTRCRSFYFDFADGAIASFAGNGMHATSVGVVFVASHVCGACRLWVRLIMCGEPARYVCD